MPKPQGEFKSDSLILHPWTAPSPACWFLYHINHINNCSVTSQGCILGLSGFSETIEFNRSAQGKWIYCFGPWTKLSSEITLVKGLCKKENGGVIVDMGEREGGEELGGVEKGETVFWMYCMREESIFSNKKGYCSCETLILWSFKL